MRVQFAILMQACITKAVMIRNKEGGSSHHVKPGPATAKVQGFTRRLRLSEELGLGIAGWACCSERALCKGRRKSSLTPPEGNEGNCKITLRVTGLPVVAGLGSYGGMERLHYLLEKVWERPDEELSIQFLKVGQCCSCMTSYAQLLMTYTDKEYVYNCKWPSKRKNLIPAGAYWAF